MTLQDMLTSYIYPEDEEEEEPGEFARRLKADNPAEYILELQGDVTRFKTAGNRADEKFSKEFLSYFAPTDRSTGEWLAELNAALFGPEYTAHWLARST